MTTHEQNNSININSNAQMSFNQTQNHGSVFYILPSNHSTLKLVTVPFDRTEFADWKKPIVTRLVSKNKMLFVDGSMPKPDNYLPDFKAWERCNNIVIGWIMTSLERSVAKSVIYFNTATDVWSNLGDRFGQSSSTQLYHIQDDLASLTQYGISIADYYTKAKALWNELDNVDSLSICCCNGCKCDTTKINLKQLQNRRITYFLIKLDDHFSQIETNILMRES
ncbi:uncharacterized protein LOC130824819 [Amaranthus tricolor]|uniref:uncharacterized protein LOC130824819 n=1 Tax=Amaranthus tricolor TaxID=29722 RepID=UPI00258DB3A3|nr:uncharacterized protein LOC130824819 [Amaranthus tricolor]